jgi:ethanolamine ammonia-lyase small subunit
MSDLESSDDEPNPPATAGQPADPWIALRRHTSARIALGRVGVSLPTAASLEFAMAHARARDAVQLPLDVEALVLALVEESFSAQSVRSRAGTREEYLRRPDLGRRVAPECLEQLTLHEKAGPKRLTIVLGDGLAALAATRHALPVLTALRAQLTRGSTQWALDMVFVATQARVAIADEIGQVRGAEAVVMMLGERPGLSSPDSLGAYLTYAPRIGRTDAQRNCVSNIRPEGLSYEEAAYKLHYLLERFCLAGVSGVSIRDSSQWERETPLL